MEEIGMNTGGLVSWEVIDNIMMEMEERKEDFIFTTIAPFIENKLQTKINKDLLLRAVTEYFKNHPEEQQ